MSTMNNFTQSLISLKQHIKQEVGENIIGKISVML